MPLDDQQHDTSESRERSLIETAFHDAFGTEEPAPSVGVDDRFALPAQDSFPGYQLIEEIHRGGQGVVYRARQHATGRDVAIKLMRDGPFAGSRGKARFEREVHVLARLKHPHIVTIHESAVVAGHRYFVMDYIPGEPLDAFVARQDWPTAMILGLFARICRAVHAAHLRGVIHRDLKPSNILVDEGDEPQILDFGLAKFDSEDGRSPVDAEVMTISGQFVGSLPWASPEQADGATDRIDLRTDVYSLGVILYQLLTGSFPYRVVGAMRDVLRTITDAQPTRPRSLHRELDDEIETIMLKALEKDPDRRYQSAIAFAEDIERYLQNQPIIARPATTTYQLKKLIARHKLPSGLLATILLLMLGSSIGATMLYRRADRLRIAAESARDAETSQRQHAEASLLRAERAEADATSSAKTANQVASFLVELFAITDPTAARGNTVTAREILDRGARRIEEELAAQPVIQATMMDLMGVVYRSLGLYDEALPLLERSLETRETVLGPDDPSVAQSLDNLAVLMRHVGDYDRAEPIQRRALEIKIATLGDDDLGTITSRSNLALLLEAQGRSDEAEALLKQTLKQCRETLGSSHFRTLSTINNLATVVQAQGRLKEAESYYREALAGCLASLADDHPITLQTTNNLGQLLHARGQLVEAEALMRRAVESLRRVMGEDHPSTLSAMNNVGLLLRDRQDYAEAEAIFLAVVTTRELVLGDEHPDTLSSVNNLALLMQETGRLEEAERLYRRALVTLRRTLGDDHPRTLTTLSNLAASLKSQRQLEQAEAMYREALALHRRTLGDDHPNTIVVMNNLALVLKNRGSYDEAVALQRRVVDVNRATFGSDHATTITSLSNLASTYKARGQLAEAEALFRELIDVGLRLHGERARSTLIAMNNLGRVLMERGEAEVAEPWFRRAVEVGADVPSLRPGILAIFQGNYGTCLMVLGRLNQAEPELLASLEGLMQTRGADHPRTQKVLHSIVGLYDQTQRPNEAEQYRAMLTAKARAPDAPQ